MNSSQGTMQWFTRPFRWCLLSIILLLSGCSKDAEKAVLHLSGNTMGTTWHITIVPPPGKSAEGDRNLQIQVEQKLATINQQFSTYLDHSEISQFNHFNSTRPFPVSREVAHVVKAAQRVSTATRGAFDITVAPLVDLWGFGKTLHFSVPAQEEIDTLMTQVGYHHLEVQDNPPRLVKDIPQLQVDLSAIAKGYAVDALADLLDSQNMTDYLVEIGGELKVKGRNPQGERWHIAVEKPLADQRQVQTILYLDNVAVATSGDYHNFFEADGIRYSHTIDPRTGSPVQHALASVTVLHDSCMIADALATALTVLGEKKGMAFAKKNKLQVLMLMRDQQDANGVSVLSTIQDKTVSPIATD